MSDIDNIIDLKADFRYAGTRRKALRNISGGIKRGKCVVFCGRSGCGKSTMLRCINHLIPDFYEGDLQGCCYLNGKDISGMEIGEVGQLASSVFQDPRSQFFTLNSSTEAAFGLENAGVDHDIMVKRVDGAFSELGLERLKNRNVFELSSGERQLVAVLSSWAMDTDVLLLDEPTANLDYAAVEQLSKLLRKLKSEGKTVVINEHRLYYLKGIVDEYWHIRDGEILKKYSAAEMEAISNGDLAGGSSKGLTLSYIIMQVLICIGSTIYPYVFAINKTLEMESMNVVGSVSDVVSKAGELINSWGMFILIAVVIVASYIGATFGKKVVEKHFNKKAEVMEG